MKRFNVVVSRADGGVELYPMKQWLRQHSDQVPAGLDPTSSTSHQLRDGLRKRGWSVDETPSEVRLVPPGEMGASVEAVLGNNEETDDLDSPDATFGLEYQLRDFIAQNIG